LQQSKKEAAVSCVAAGVAQSVAANRMFKAANETYAALRTVYLPARE
jgi:hypothetical protein